MRASVSRDETQSNYIGENRFMGEDEKPTLFVCHGDEGGPRVHPCRRVQEAMKAKGIDYDKVIAAHGSPIPFLRKGSRDELRDATGAEKLPVLKLPDGTVLAHSKAILAWVAEQPEPPRP